jgi:hypothetical protein
MWFSFQLVPYLMYSILCTHYCELLIKLMCAHCEQKVHKVITILTSPGVVVLVCRRIVFKGTVQRKLTWVKSGINQQLMRCRLVFFL